LRHFINHQLLAPNVLTVPVDMSIVREFEELTQSLDPGSEYFTLVPWKNSTDLRWISAATEAAFATFESAFERLDAARHVRDYLDLEREVRLYAGYLVTRSECTKLKFHVDWMLTNNEAFTLLTPLCGFEPGQKLLYKKLTGEVAEYSYKPGEAIIFGDHFAHSTPRGAWNPPFTLLVFQFGTDKMVHWPKVLRTQGTQCSLIRCPNGKFVTVDPWKRPVDDEKQLEPIDSRNSETEH
jgi:hypothetical protein